MALLSDTFRRQFWVQMSTLMFINFSQGVMLTTPFTLGVYMVRSFLAQRNNEGGPLDEQVVGQLTGMLAGTFSFAQFTTSILWGMVSNAIGRKPVILIGTFASAVSMLGYGAAGSYGQAVAARALGGLFNGVLGAWKCMIGETGDSLVQGKMFSMMSLAWGMGTTLGPLVGGVLSRPCDHTPSLPGCGPGELLQARPFLLPGAVCAAAMAASALAAAVLMVETLPEEQRQRQMASLAAHAASVRQLIRAGLHGAAPLPQPKELNPQLLKPTASMQQSQLSWALGTQVSASLQRDHDQAVSTPADEPYSNHAVELTAQPHRLDTRTPEGREDDEEVQHALQLHLGVSSSDDESTTGLLRPISPDLDPNRTCPPHSLSSGRLRGAGPAPPGLVRTDSAADRMGALRRFGSLRTFINPILSPFRKSKGREQTPGGVDEEVPGGMDEEAPLMQSSSLAPPQAAPVVMGGCCGGGAVAPTEDSTAARPELSTLGAWYENRQIVLTLAGYGLTAFFFCAVDELIPIFAAAPIAESGLAMTEHQLAPVLAVFGVGLMIYSAFGYPPMQRAIGTVRLSRWGLVGAVATCVIIPLSNTTLSALGPSWAMATLYASQLMKTVAQTAAFTGALVAVNAAPHRSQLGTVNGVGQTIASLVRGLGPLLGGLMWSAALSLRIPGQQFVPFLMSSTLAVGAWFAFRRVHLPNLQ